MALREEGRRPSPPASASLGIPSDGLATGASLLEFDDLRRPWLLWKTWLAAPGLERAKPKGILRFNQLQPVRQVIHAAVAGQGIALDRMELLAPLVAEGKLIQLQVLLARPMSEHSHWLLPRRGAAPAGSPDVAGWIRAEAGTAGG